MFGLICLNLLLVSLVILLFTVGDCFDWCLFLEYLLCLFDF